MKAPKTGQAPRPRPRSPVRVGLIGLGTMGGIIARALIDAGHEVCGHDPVSARRTQLRRAGGTAMRSNAEVAAAAELLICSLPSAAALHAVVEELRLAGPPSASGSAGAALGNGAGASDARRRLARPAQIVVETSTLAVADKRAAARALRQQGRQMVDAPISGTATATPAQTWVMYLGGPQAACREVASLARAFTLDAPRVGPLGAATQLKLAANHLVAIYNVAYAEMVTLCRRMGLDPAVALQHMGHSPYLGTGAMRLRVPFMIARHYEPATMKLELWQKDMQLIGEMARSVQCPTPLLDACAPIYTAAVAMGLGQADTAAASEVLERMARDRVR